MTAPRSVPQVYTHSPAHPNDNEEPLMPRIYVQGRQMALEYASRNFLPFKIAFQGHIACHLLTSLSAHLQPIRDAHNCTVIMGADAMCALLQT